MDSPNKKSTAEFGVLEFKLDFATTRTFGFVVLFEFEEFTPINTILFAEALCAVIFRSMTNYQTWDLLLPEEFKNLVQPCGVNVASPLKHLSYGFQNFDGFHQLQYFTDPLSREYYVTCRRNGQIAQKVIQRENAADILQNGGEVPMTVRMVGKSKRYEIQIPGLSDKVSFSGAVGNGYGLEDKQMVTILMTRRILIRIILKGHARSQKKTRCQA